MPPTWPIDVVSIGSSTGGAITWKERGQLGVTLIVKVTLSLRQGETATIVPPGEIARTDHHFDRSPVRSVEAASDLAVYRPRCDVTFIGHAHAPPGRPAQALTVRIGVFRERALVDKTLHVFGDRDTATAPPKPFQRMQLVYERGAASKENPVGKAPSLGQPNVVDPRGGDHAAGFGPISRYWRARRDLLEHVDRARFEAPVAEIGEGFPWEYFQSAPPDQRVPFLRGDEWIVLDGLHPALARLQTQLPGIRAAARLTTFSPAPETREVELALDTLAIDGDRLTASLVWRGRAPIASEALLATARAHAGVELPGAPIAWPAAVAPATAQVAEPSSEKRKGGLGSTVDLDDGAAAAAGHRAATPFQGPLEDEPHTETITISMADAAMLRDVTLPPTPGSLRAPFPIAPAGDPGSPLRSAPIPWFESKDAVIPADPEQEATVIGPSPFRAQRAVEPSNIAAPESARLPITTPAQGASPVDAARFFHAAPRAATGADRAEDGAAEPPRRISPAIPIVNPTSLTAATLPWQVKPPQDSLTVVVKGTFDLVPHERARLRAESAYPTGDLNVDDDEDKSLRYGSDFAVFKPKADVTVTGHAHAPGGSAPAAQVEVRFGSKLRRRIAVFGDRRWQQGIVSAGQTQPAPFTSMPLTWERAFGGPKSAQNPAGAGHKASPGDALPNLEDPDHLISSPGDAPAPACFAPVAVTWRERAGFLGTYGGRYLKTRWPYFPEDFDWRYFQNAPASQQLDRIEGDETYAISGMHPAHPKIEGTLPGVRPRCFVQRTKEAGGGFEEIALRLDTAAFEVDDLALHLVWRGLYDVSEEEAPEINALFVMLEEPGAAAVSLADARARYIAASTPKEPIEEEPEEPRTVANDVEEPDEEAPTEPDPNDADEVLARERELMDQLRAAGVPEDAIHPVAPPPPPDPEGIAASLRDAGVPEEEVAAMLEAMRPPGGEAAEEPPIDLRARVVERLRFGEPLTELDLEGADLSELDFSGRSLAGSNLQRASLKGASLVKANLAGAILAGADLTGAWLEEADLEGADLTLATVVRANFAGASLSAADFTGAQGEGAMFEGAKGERTQFAGGAWTNARFDGVTLSAADFTGAALDGASFEGAVLAELRLYEAHGAGVIFDGARMPGARAEGASFPRGSFKKLVAPGSVWESAILDEAIFHAAELAGSSFSRSSCQRANFATADLTEARLRRAKLMGAVMLKTNLMMASLERADLTGADLRGANLHAAETWRAKLDDAKLDLAIVSQSKLAKEKR